LVTAIVAVPPAVGQYAAQVIDLKKTSDLYDSRGVAKGTSATVDGRLLVSNVNGNVTYSYPVSRTTVCGYPLTVNFNYCGGVAVTAYAEWDPGNPGNPYSRWNRFHQNRPAWILGVNGFAIQALATATTFHSAPGQFPTSRNSFDDRDLVWTIDGYDVCNRMERIASTGGTASTYVDVIRILRDDGGVLELVNHRKAIPYTPEHTRPDLYTGFYVVNEANSPAYGIVEYDSTYWPHYVRRYADVATNGPQYPFIPRRLRYYSGDGLEYRFREWPVPFGTQVYSGRGLDRPDRFGGMWAGPTIFYLESINSASGTVAEFSRSRHQYPRDRVVLRGGNIFDPVIDSTLDSTRGRALITRFRGHRISYGDGAMAIEALGRTIRVRFDTLIASGTGATDQPIPLSTRGHYTSTTAALATVPETGPDATSIYGSWLAYVTEITDPEGRATRFDYQPYRRTYVNFGFPHANPTGNQVQTLTLRNYRLTQVIEPTCRYEIDYAYGSPLMESTTRPSSPDTSLHAGVFPVEQAYWTNNVVSCVRRRDNSNVLLTTTLRHYTYDAHSRCFVNSSEQVIDEIDGSVRSVSEYFRPRVLENGIPFAPEPRYTENYQTLVMAADTVAILRTFDSIVSGSHLCVPTNVRTYVNGVLKEDTRTTYVTDVVRAFGGDTGLSHRYGNDVVRRIEERRHPLSGRAITVDTVDLLHLPLLDTTLVRRDSLLLKFESLDRYFALLRQGADVGTWEESMYDPRVAVYQIDERPQHVWLPPFHSLEYRRVVGDSIGSILGGGSRSWSTGGGDVLTERLYRGHLTGDSIVAAGGASALLTSRTDYARLWEGDRPIRRTNANGASTRFYTESYSSPTLRDASGSYRAVGTIVRGDGRRVDTVLPHGGFLADVFEVPLAREEYVRRYDPSGIIVTDSLLSLSAYTYGGVLSVVVDPNGVLSRYDYDQSMRLKRAWLPYDNPVPNASAAYAGTRSMDFYGETIFVTSTDTLRCTTTDSVVTAGQTTTVSREGLFAATPAACAPPPCPCARTGNSSKDGRSLAANCTAPIPFTARPGYTGRLSLPVSAASPIRDARSISAAWIELNVGPTTGRCLPLRVRIPRLSFERTYILNCSSDDVAFQPDAGGGDGSAVPDNIQSMRADLSEVIPSLRGVVAGETIEVTLECPAVGTSAEFVSGLDADDARPRLMITGTFATPGADDDFTIAFLNNDSTLTTTANVKIDDRFNTGSAIAGRRLASTVHRHGPDGRLRASRSNSTDSTTWTHSGLGRELSERDAEGHVVRQTFDAEGRLRETLHPDGAVEGTDYVSGLPISFGILDQDFFGFCRVAYATDARGVVTATYTDARDRVRRVVVDTAGLRLTTRINFDPLGRIASAISPGGDTAAYVYDAYGRVRAKRHPDVGMISYGYDAVGNLRFSQTQEQAMSDRLTFHEYDDVNRLVLVGEAEIDTHGGDHPIDGTTSSDGPSSGRSHGKYDHARLLAGDALSSRLSELPATLLRDGGVSAIVTASATLWMNPAFAVPRSTPDSLWRTLGCDLPPDPSSGDVTGYHGDIIAAPAPVPVVTPRPKATVNDFEHVARYPNFPRMAVSYDRLPPSVGPVWGDFPVAAIWDSLAPAAHVRNLKGREAAVAWRDRPDEAYHYAVTSYDDRGRPEALLRRNEGIGYEAIYFRYNALNQVVRMTIADPLNAVHVWVGYDSLGRTDSIWVRMTPGGGLARAGFANLRRPFVPTSRPDQALLAYAYARDGRPASMTMPAIAEQIRWSYNPRNWVDSMVASREGRRTFAEGLQYDASGRVVTRRTEQGSAGASSESYLYDNVHRLTDWGGGNSSNTTSYQYDSDGNRTSTSRPDALHGTVVETNSFAGPGPGSNRLARTTDSRLDGSTVGTVDYSTDPDGAVVGRRQSDASGSAMGEAVYEYSYREVLSEARVTGGGNVGVSEWRYRYAPNGERELKRLATAIPGTTGSVVSWNVLGSRREPVARWSGVQLSIPVCGLPTGYRAMRPVEYLVPGLAGTAAASLDPAGNPSYRVADHLGSTRVVLDDAGEVISRSNYDPNGTVQPIVGLPPRAGFVGRELDTETGLIDMGVRKYSSRDGRFRTVDPAWEMFRNLSPYQYARLDPMRRIDPDGMWDIIVVASTDRKSNPIATAYLVDRNGQVVYTFQVKVMGQHRNRMKTDGDTPFGTYDINNRSPWISGKSRKAYGAQPRLAFEPVAGEALASGRSAIRLHGGRQEELVTDPETGKRRWVRRRGATLESLPPTQGCLRALDDVVRELRRRTEELESADPQEQPGVVRVVTREEYDRTSAPVSEP